MNNKRDLRMYILVNEEVKMGKGKCAGQVGHAVNVLVYQYMLGTQDKQDLIHEYMQGEIKKVVLKAPEEFLLQQEDVGKIAIRDRGHTQIEPNTLTCVNMGIFDYDGLVEMNSILLKFPLY